MENFTAKEIQFLRVQKPFIYSKLLGLVEELETHREAAAYKPGRTGGSKQSVAKVSIQGRIIERYESISQAARANKIHPSAIDKVLSGDRNSAGGYVWKRIPRMKSCPKCGKLLTMNHYYKSGERISSPCKQCHRNQMRRKE